MPIKLAGLGEERIRLLPIICLTIPTTLLFIKLLLLRFKEELEKDYSLFAKSKGLLTVYFDTSYFKKCFINDNLLRENKYFIYAFQFIYYRMDFQYIWYVCFCKRKFEIRNIYGESSNIIRTAFILFRLLHTFLQNVIKERV